MKSNTFSKLIIENKIKIVVVSLFANKDEKGTPKEKLWYIPTNNIQQYFFEIYVVKQ